MQYIKRSYDLFLLEIEECVLCLDEIEEIELVVKTRKKQKCWVFFYLEKIHKYVLILQHIQEFSFNLVVFEKGPVIDLVQ